jgi:fructuronate reductase
LVARFANPAMKHALRQIGSDGSLKVPYRWLDVMCVLREEQLGTHFHELALAAWAAATRLNPDGSQRYGTTDPRAKELGACWSAPTPEETVGRLVGTLGYHELADDAALVRRVAGLLAPVSEGRIEEELG